MKLTILAGPANRRLAEAVAGRLNGVEVRSPIIVDDMISTGGIIEAAVRALLSAGCLLDVIVAASHALLVGPVDGAPRYD